MTDTSECNATRSRSVQKHSNPGTLILMTLQLRLQSQGVFEKRDRKHGSFLTVYVYRRERPI
jgi:hypothetical protein